MKIIISIIIAAVLSILPLPPMIAWLRPQWVFVVLLFWWVHTPERVALGTAFIVGLFMDLLLGTLLGQHAAIFVLIAFILIRLLPQFGKLPMWQQGGVVWVLVMFNLALQYWVLDAVNQAPTNWLYWLSSITTALFWPVVTALLQRTERRVQIKL